MKAITRIEQLLAQIRTDRDAVAEAANDADSAAGDGPGPSGISSSAE